MISLPKSQTQLRRGGGEVGRSKAKQPEAGGHLNGIESEPQMKHRLAQILIAWAQADGGAAPHAYAVAQPPSSPNFMSKNPPSSRKTGLRRGKPFTRARGTGPPARILTEK